MLVDNLPPREKVGVALVADRTGLADLLSAACGDPNTTFIAYDIIRGEERSARVLVTARAASAVPDAVSTPEPMTAEQMAKELHRAAVFGSQLRTGERKSPRDILGWRVERAMFGDTPLPVVWYGWEPI